jgi:hypothetical protein
MLRLNLYPERSTPNFDAVIATVATESADIHHRLDMLQTSVNEIAALRASRADVEVMRSANGGAASE